MDFNLPEEIQILRETVRRFVDKELIPLEREYRHDSEGPMPEHLLKPLQEKTKSMGLWMLDVPAEYGGAGLGLLPRCIIHEELARAASLPFRSLELFGPEVRPVLFHCNDEQKKKFLEPVLRGELRFCFAQTEPDAGSDPANMRTRAVKDGDHFVVNGTKRFITAAGRADYAQLMAVTDPEKKARGGITCFAVDLKSPGVVLERQWPTMKHLGNSSSTTCACPPQTSSVQSAAVSPSRKMDRRRTHPRPRRATGGHRAACARHDDRILESSRDFRPASRRPPSDPIHDRRLGDGIARRAQHGLRMRLARRSR